MSRDHDLIDEIAVAAMVGILANPGHLRGEAKTAPLVAEVAYDYAEAMLEESKKRRRKSDNA